ncbi:MAG: hypothetical protein QNJ77_08680 [Acidimicrobiia bacterium]|nr:hypothetical protein [Acidimicrobiia bacterium]
MRYLSKSLSRSTILFGLLLLLALVVAGCGNDSSDAESSDTTTSTAAATTSTTAAPTTAAGAEEDHDHDEEGHDHDEEGQHDDEEGNTMAEAGDLTRGRLVVASATLPEIYVVDLDSFSVSTVPVEHEGAILQGTGGMSPYSWMAHYPHDRVQIVDVGTDFSRHGTHYHISEADPELTDFSISGANPAHITAHDGLVAVWFDGSGDIHLISETQLTSGDEVEVDIVTANQPHHGVALKFHGHLLVTVAETVEERSVPMGVVAYDFDDTSTTVHESETCTGLHGEASLGHYVAFGCDEGVLVIHHTHSGFSSEVVPYPDGSSLRPYFFKSHEASPLMVGDFGPGLVAVDPGASSVTSHNLPSPQTAYAFEDGEHLLVLATDGALYRVSLDDFSMEGEPLPLVPAFGEGDTANIFVAANRLYATDSRDPAVVAVDLETWEVLDAGIVLPSAPYTFSFRAVSAVSPDW